MDAEIDELKAQILTNKALPPLPQPPIPSVDEFGVPLARDRRGRPAEAAATAEATAPALLYARASSPSNTRLHPVVHLHPESSNNGLGSTTLKFHQTMDKRFPGPGIFDGTTPEYCFWRRAPKSRLEAACDATTPFTKMIAYVQSCTTGEPWRTININTNGRHRDWTRIEDMFQEFDAYYGVHDVLLKAKTALSVLKQGKVELLSKYVLDNRSLCQEAEEKLDTHSLWLTLNNKYKHELKRDTRLPFHDFCIKARLLEDNWKSIVDTTPANPGRGAGDNAGRGRGSTRGGRGGGNVGRGAAVRLIPMRYKNLGVLDDAGRKKLIDERRCFRCRETGYDRTSAECVSSPQKGRYEFGNVQHETPITNTLASAAVVDST
ncbi:unnamed protein product [Zymoseptoria tritici ST99CH_1E4]|uniref:Uncharacterized protein n=1 Tax=Zymoseptoria tritici ST99CH_1E4 TaxID=1276532 RepID=A0A2H1H9P2_ZYMTR|nr:unnamed protein product [Zymoseptoria tritici ST99CH_1E4]